VEFGSSEAEGVDCSRTGGIAVVGPAKKKFTKERPRN